MAQPDLSNVLDKAFALAKAMQSVQSNPTDYGPFSTVPADALTVPLIDKGTFSDAEIDRMIVALEERAKKEDLSAEGMAFLKIFVQVLFAGAKLAGV